MIEKTRSTNFFQNEVDSIVIIGNLEYDEMLQRSDVTIQVFITFLQFVT